MIDIRLVEVGGKTNSHHKFTSYEDVKAFAEARIKSGKPLETAKSVEPEAVEEKPKKKSVFKKK